MTDGAAPNVAQADYWEGRASSWIEAEEFTGRVAGPFGRQAMERLGLGQGARLLDVGCGTGATTIELARRVSPGGAVVGIDIAPSMIAAARERAARDGVDNGEFLVADAQAHEFGEGAFDGVFSQFGVMFFADPVVAFANLRRALRDGGRLAFACWQNLFLNEWMFVPGSAVVAVTGEPPPMPAPGAPGPFSLAEPGRVEAVLREAGFRSIEVVPHGEQVVVAEGELDLVVEAMTRVGAVREALAARDDLGFRDQVVSAVRSALAERLDGGALQLDAAAFVVSADRG